MKKKKIILAALMLLTLFGCGSKPEPKPLRVVTEITVICEGSDSVDRLYYNTEEKMQLILHHIRSIGIQDTPEIDPDTITAHTIQITLVFSDNSRKTYTHKGTRYFRENALPWKEIAPEKTEGLYQLLMLMPSDQRDLHLHRPQPENVHIFPEFGL